jgi:hypothetical protein
MNFTSQICTTLEQSERLLALGLKKETADCSWNTVTLHGTPITYPSQDSWMDYSIISDNHFPAWSLDRLLKMIPEWISYPTQYDSAPLRINKDSMYYLYRFFDRNGEEDTSTVGDNEAIGSHNIYDYAVSVIGFLIREGHFCKEYLEE